MTIMMMTLIMKLMTHYMLKYSDHQERCSLNLISRLNSICLGLGVKIFLFETEPLF